MENLKQSDNETKVIHCKYCGIVTDRIHKDSLRTPLTICLPCYIKELKLEK